ncbi:MAG: hypothetical protein DWQ19_08830 [Crenarchaeota archaeon]|nr:MAG: hypothetical protein DWQ19_08830 [Thermoproteota archaeon]
MLSDKLRTLLLKGASQAGGFDPDEVFPYIEEQLTQAEYLTAQLFLTWICENNLTFGHGNIQQRFAEHLKTS